MNKKKICFITPIYLPANLYGSDNYVKSLAEEFAKKNFEVSIITSNAENPRYWYNWFEKKVTPKYEKINHISVYRLPCNQIVLLLSFLFAKYAFFLPKKMKERLQLLHSGPYLIGFGSLLKEINPDIVHCSPSPLNINLQLIETIQVMKRKPFFIFTPFFHAHVSLFTNSYMKKIFDAADIIHVISKTEKNDIIKQFNINEKKFSIIPLFIDVKTMTASEKLKKSIEKFKVTYHLKNKKIILFAGIKGSMKGAIDTLQAVNELYKKDQSYKFIAIGNNTIEWDKAKDTVDVSCLLDFTYKKGLEKEIIFASCDIFCLPSKSESFGLVYLEAWHKKKPVIAANIAAVKEFIGTDGVFVQYGNRDQIMKSITTLEDNKIALEKFGKKGYNKLMQKYTFTKVISSYINLFVNN